MDFRKYVSLAVEPGVALAIWYMRYAQFYKIIRMLKIIVIIFIYYLCISEDGFLGFNYL